MSNGLSSDSKEAMKGKCGEDVVNADVASQGYEATKKETNREIEIKWHTQPSSPKWFAWFS